MVPSPQRSGCWHSFPRRVVTSYTLTLYRCAKAIVKHLPGVFSAFFERPANHFSIVPVVAGTYHHDDTGTLNRLHTRSGSPLLALRAQEIGMDNEQRSESRPQVPAGPPAATDDPRRNAGVVRLWDVTTGRERAVLKGHTGGVHAVACTPDGETLASAGQDRTFKLWDPVTGQERGTLRGTRETSWPWY